MLHPPNSSPGSNLTRRHFIHRGRESKAKPHALVGCLEKSRAHWTQDHHRLEMIPMHHRKRSRANDPLATQDALLPQHLAEVQVVLDRTG